MVVEICVRMWRVCLRGREECAVKGLYCLLGGFSIRSRFELLVR